MPKTNPLAQARRHAGLTQRQAAACIGLQGSTAGNEYGQWERGDKLAPDKHRGKFITFLRHDLNLEDDLEQIDSIWNEVMVSLWGWEPLRASERLTRTQDYLIEEQ
jgi:hypothetical protein